MKTTAVAALVLPAIASAHSASRRACKQSDQPVFQIRPYVEQGYMADIPEREPSCMARGQVYKSGDIMFEDEKCESGETKFTWHPDFTNQIVLLDENMRITDHCIMNLNGSPDFTGPRVAVLGDESEDHGNCAASNASWETELVMERSGNRDPVVIIKDSKSGKCLRASKQEYVENSQTPDKFTLTNCNPNNPYQQFVLEVECDAEVALETTAAATEAEVIKCSPNTPTFTISSFVGGRTFMDDYPERQPSCVARGQVYKSGDIMYEDMGCESEQRFAWHPDYDNQLVILDKDSTVTNHCMMNLNGSPDFTGEREAVLGDSSTNHGDCSESNAIWETIDVDMYLAEEVVQIRDTVSGKCLQASNQQYADNSQTPDKYTLYNCEAANPYQHFVLKVDCKEATTTEAAIETAAVASTTSEVSESAECATEHPVFTITTFVDGRNDMDDYPVRQPSCMARGQVYKSGDIMYEDMGCESEQRFAWHPDYDNQLVILDKDSTVTNHCMMNLNGSPDFTGERVAVLGDSSTNHGDCSESNAIWETIDVDMYLAEEVVQIRDTVSGKCLQASNQKYADNSQTPDKYTLYDCEPANPYQHFVLHVDCGKSPSGY